MTRSGSGDNPLSVKRSAVVKPMNMSCSCTRVISGMKGCDILLVSKLDAIKTCMTVRRV